MYQGASLPPLKLQTFGWIHLTHRSETTSRITWTYSEEGDFEDDKVKTHGYDDGTNQPQVPPRTHHNQRLVLGDAATKHPRQTSLHCLFTVRTQTYAHSRLNALLGPWSGRYYAISTEFINASNPKVLQNILEGISDAPPTVLRCQSSIISM